VASELLCFCHLDTREANMATPLNQLPARHPDSDLLNVVVETPKGCRNKYKYDEEHGLWRLSKVLPLGTAFPFDFGFIPSTRGEDGDPLDVLVLLDEPAFPGCVVPARLIGIVEAEQTQGGKTIRNDRLVAVIETPYNPPAFHTLLELSPQWLAELEHFFISYNQMEGRQFKPLSHQGPEKAQQVLEAALHAHAPVRSGPGKSPSRSPK
jgi:inorganic pyrophosphatase